MSFKPACEIFSRPVQPAENADPLPNPAVSAVSCRFSFVAHSALMKSDRHSEMTLPEYAAGLIFFAIAAEIQDDFLDLDLVFTDAPSAIRELERLIELRT